MALNQISGGKFSDAFGSPLSRGYLILTLSHDAQVGSTQVAGGIPIRVPLDSNGNVAGTVSVQANDVLTPANTFYLVQIFKSDGTLASRPNLQLTVTSSPSPFDLGANWTPNN
jgi:hypothetical protein